MAKQLLTEPQCANARIKKGEAPDKLLADGDGLFLRVRRQRGDQTKTWLFVYSLNGKRAKQGLGQYPAVGLARARALAQESREAVARGGDPVAAREALERARQAEEAAKAGRPTVEGIFRQWLVSLRRRIKGGQRAKVGAEEAARLAVVVFDPKSTQAQVLEALDALKTPKSAAEIKRAAEKDVLPIIGRMYADEVRRRDVMRVLDKVKERDVPRYASYLLQYMRQMFKFAFVRELVGADPTFGIDRDDVGGKSEPRDRTLEPNEVSEMGAKLSGAGLSQTAEAAFWLILATCCRVGELTRAKWSEFDEEAGTWTIPAAHSKNGREHLVHLSPFALKQLKAMEKYATSKVWLFPGPDGKTHGDPKSLQKQFRDRQRSTQIKGRSKQLGALELKSGRWTVHDLRRTGATFMGELGVRPDIIERVLNHKQDKLSETYQRQKVMAARKEAFSLLGERLELLTREKAGNVVAGKFGAAAA